MKLYFFNGGTLTADKSAITLNRDHGVPYAMPVPFFLIQHEKGNVLFDCGLPEEINGDIAAHWKGIEKAYIPEMKPEQHAVAQLEKLGLKPEDIDFVVISHLHNDHTGALRYFTNSTILVQRAEMEWAYTADWFMKGGYIRKDFDLPKLKYSFLDGEKDNNYDIFNDGSVKVVMTAGHTPGHQSLLVNLEKSGSMMLSQDSVYLNEILNKKRLPGVCWSNHEAISTIAMLNRMKAAGVTIVPGHDQNIFETYKAAPEFYE